LPSSNAQVNFRTGFAGKFCWLISEGPHHDPEIFDVSREIERVRPLPFHRRTVGKTWYRRRAMPIPTELKLASGKGAAITEEGKLSLDRSQRRMLRRVFNGRTVPIIVDGRPFLTYKEASQYLLSLTPGARENAYSEMRSAVHNGSRVPS